MSLLSQENYTKGFLIDDEWMGGITESSEHPGQFVGYVISHQTGQYLGVHLFPNLDNALSALNGMPRKWTFESTSSCGSGKCGKKSGGKCSTQCKHKCS